MTRIWRSTKDGIKRVARRAGYDIVPFDPNGGSLANHLARLLSLLRINCVLDVGAHRGSFGWMLGEIGYRGHIVSFEPIADNVEALRRASSSNPRWTVHHLALGNTDDVAEIHVARHSNFSSLMKTSAYGLEQFAGMSDPIRVERVRLARLDTILDSAVSHIDQPRIFLKTDTQGNDMEVFRGAAGCLDRIEGLQAELYFREVYEGAPLFDAALAELQAAGFELTDLYPVGRAAHLEIIDADCLMVRTGAAVDSISGL